MITVGLVGPHAYCVLMHSGGIPLSHHEGTDAYIQWQDNDRYALHSAVVTVLVLTGPGGPPEHAHRLGTVAQRCAN